MMTSQPTTKLLKRKKVGEILIARGLVTQAQVDHALELQRKSVPRQLLGEIITELGLCTADQIIEVLADAHGIPYAKLESSLIDLSIVRLLPRDFMVKHNVLPLFYVDKVLTVAVSEPANLYLIEEINGRVNGIVQIVAASANDIRTMIDQTVPHVSSHAIQNLVDEASTIDVIERQVQDVVNLEEVASESPVIKLVNYLIYNAVRERASDIHIEPDDNILRVRYRIDGELVEQVSPPVQMQPAIVSRIKIMASLDISERRLPQDGSIHVLMQGKPVDLRISILPNTFGEKVVIRIIDTSNVLVKIDQLGMASEMATAFYSEIHRPHGLVLVTGPTGSGKSTTLYSVLSELDAPDVNICTVEDPIEFNLRRINQFQVQEKIGLTFAAILRSLLRQDPDIIMVGEMRDTETAVIGVQASLTGHMVFSTLHTNDAPGAITRLYNLGVESYLVGASLTAVLAQRLVRQICLHCRAEQEPSARSLSRLQQLGVNDIQTFYMGRGCTRCGNSGYLGRIGIFELLIPDDEFRDMITAGDSLDKLRHKAQTMGMKRLFDDGVQKVRAGITSLEEMLRVIV